ncbi:rhomboid family intramembrane serine protease [Crocinitomix catalasitica]|nr:rhomboid family intramembrane serine protease [Crocinitomix catalasitica]
MFKSKITRISLGISLMIIALMWAVFILDYNLDLDLYKYGVHPMHADGLIGILASPFIHSTEDFGHILNNTTPMLVLSWMLFYHYREIATKTLVLIYLAGGVGVWFLAGKGYHIGMSGVIYGLAGFLVLSGFLRKNMRIAAISLVVVFLYGSMIWGIFPIKVQMSWEGHLMGLMAGVLAAILFREKGPKPTKMRYEIEEEMGVEIGDYWKLHSQKQKGADAEKSETKKDGAEAESKDSRIIINYHIVPKKVEPIDPDEESSSEKEDEA